VAGDGDVGERVRAGAGRRRRMSDDGDDDGMSMSSLVPLKLNCRRGIRELGLRRIPSEGSSASELRLPVARGGTTRQTGGGGRVFMGGFVSQVQLLGGPEPAGRLLFSFCCFLTADGERGMAAGPQS